MFKITSIRLKTHYNQHPLNELPGVGRHTSRALNLYGINTIEQFALFTEQEITALLGNSGIKLLNTARELIHA